MATAVIPMLTTLLDNPPPLCVEKRKAVKVSNRTNYRMIYNLFKGSFSVTLLTLAFCMSMLLSAQEIKCGAERFEAYADLLEGKKVGVLAHQSSIVGDKHLVDFLLENGVQVIKVFAPEHGFRGKAAAGEHIEDGKDRKTGLPIISLYGKDRRPNDYHLEGVEIMLFDLQDVGTRFYTYISTMSLAMDACAEHDIPFVVLDRPNPNGYYVDGPVLDLNYRSFVGMHAVPVVHGMTVGEYAQMVNLERWLPENRKVELIVVRMEGYDHSQIVDLPIKPSPNLPNASSVSLYPSLCFFEGTTVSIGRGTDFPFQVMGAPWMPVELGFQFTPKSRSEAPRPKWKDEVCNGVDLRNFGTYFIPGYSGIYWYWLVEAYEACPEKEKFFSSFFDRLAGTNKIRLAIEGGATAEDITALYQEELKEFKKMRRKYLLYQ
jgi:uncharacterized protein YbbC (DUF1343 family)